MRFERAGQSPTSNPPTTLRDDQRQRPGDIVVRDLGAGTYVVSTIAGVHIGICQDRFDAMRRACLAARATGANVWICREGTSET